MPSALTFSEAVSGGMYFPRTPSSFTVSVGSGAPRTVEEVTVVVSVCGLRFASVVVTVAVYVKIEISVL